MKDGRLWLAFGSVVVLAVAVTFVATADLGRSWAIATTRAQAEDAATLAISILRGELEKQRALPLILARDPDVRSALTGGDRHALNQKLEDIAGETHTAVIYLLDTTGVAIAASNWSKPTSFIGRDYFFRDYYATAVAKGSAEQFALGTVSKRPGLFITNSLKEEGKLLGVVVIKVEFDRVEADWRALGGETYVVDRRGVVLLSTIADWRFRMESPIRPPETIQSVRSSLQSWDAPLTLLPLVAEGGMLRGTPPFMGLRTVVRRMVPTTDWHLDVLLPVDRAIRSEQSDLRVRAALFLMPGIALAALLLRRHQRGSARRRVEAQAKAELERRVEERTAALTQSHARLMEEMTERTRAQERLADAREELAKANRLATLGQVTAGVAHEINQPLAAIRTYTENARVFLQRQDSGSAESALGRVVGLIERIGSITDTLRTFARRGGGTLEPVSLENAISGALMILDAALRHANIVPAVNSVPTNLKVLARRVELEQVLVNLLRNAVEAIGPGPRDIDHSLIALDIAADDVHVTLRVADRGPGLDVATLAALFTPFRSSKPRGLGLGLVISHDIVTSFGGTLTAQSLPGEGCTFTIVLQRAS